MKRVQKWWTPMLLGAALMAVLVGVAAAVPPEKPSAASPPRQVVLCAADFYPTRDIAEYWNDGFTLDTMKDNTQYRFLAPVNFVAPYWVTVDKVELFAYDNNTAGKIVMDLYRSKPSIGSETLMASIDTGHAFADPVNQPPVDQLPEIHAGAASGNLKLLHNIVGAQRSGCQVEEGVDLGHRPADAPSGGHFSPAANEHIPGGLVAYFRHMQPFQKFLKKATGAARRCQC